MQFIEWLPSVGSLPGFIFYSVLAYIVSFSLSICMSRFVANNIDIDKGMKEAVVQRRQQDKEREALVRDLIKLCK